MSVLVFIENRDTNLRTTDFELASYAVALAKQLNTNAIALWLGTSHSCNINQFGRFGIQTIYTCSSPVFDIPSGKLYSNAITTIVNQLDVQLVVMAASNLSKAIAPRVAVQLKAGFMSGVQGLPAQLTPFVANKRLFNGKILACSEVDSKRMVITLAPNSFGLIETPTDSNIIDFAFDYEPAIRVIETTKPNNTIQLSEASIVVSGGRGMHSPDNWRPLEELAHTLGAALACSRPVSDDGWRPHSEHVGQTGKIIAPNLYMAFGISGATQHLGGVSSSKCIVAVNTDPSAPIFEVADYGIVGDAQTVIPQLIEAVKNK